MSRFLRHFELPPSFIVRFRPVTAHPKERGVLRHVFDPLGLRFYRELATAGSVPDGAVWSLMPPKNDLVPTLVPGEFANAVGHVVTQVVDHACQNPDDLGYPLIRRLGIRSRAAVDTLHRLRRDILDSPSPADVLAIIDQRIANLTGDILGRMARQ